MAMQVIFRDEDEKEGRIISQRMLWRMWSEFYKGSLTIALPDTYGNDYGLQDFKEFAASWAGVRHDSGDPFEFGEKVIALYQRLGIDSTSKTIVFSDGLTHEVMIALWQRFHGRLRVSFGWGTHLTNDMGFDQWENGNRGLAPLSIIMKLVAVIREGKRVKTVKLSDNPGKVTGEREEVQRVIALTHYNASAHQAVECVV